jgi:hypothetical protein
MDGARIATAWTDNEGRAEFVVPAPDAEGEHALTIWSKTRFNTRRDRLSISVRPGHELFFSLDRPLAQPGQAVHLRALALTADHRPDEGREVTFEILDSAGNRILRETTAASEHGIAHATLRLADEVLLGGYTAAARAGSIAVERPFWVKRYVLPRFRIAVVTEQAFVLPGEAVRGVVTASYVFGNPVAGARVAVHADVYDGDVRATQQSVATSDTSGRSSFSIDAPARGTLLRLTAEVTDSAGHTESASHVIPIVRAPLLIHAVPTCRAIARGLDNEITVLVLGADGRPVAADIMVNDRTIRTSALGSASMVVNGSRTIIRARDDSGHVAEQTFEFPSDASVAIRPSRRTPKAGDVFPVEILAPRDGRLRVALRSDRNLIAEHDIDIKEGRGAISFDLPDDLEGMAAIECRNASTLLWVRGKRRLDVQVRPTKAVVKPGEELSIRVDVKDADGRPARAALGVSILDDALRGLVEIDPETELAAFATGGWAVGHAARTLWRGEGDEACNLAATLLLSGRSLEAKSVRFTSKGAP